MIIPRIITAVLGIPIVLVTVYLGSLPFLIFVVFIILASNWEYYLMMKTALKPVDPFSVFFAAIFIPFSFYIGSVDLGLNFIVMVIGILVIMPFFIEVFRTEKILERIAYTYIGIFFISFSLSHFILIREIPNHGRALVYLLFISVWICDTTAYFVGKSLGKRRLSSVSPRKTLEGFLAGILSVVLFFYIVSKKYDFLTQWQFILFSLIVAIAAQYSDLAQSLIKRACGVKDSSNLLPGHGGIFDRFDSYLFLSPLFYYFYVIVR